MLSGVRRAAAPTAAACSLHLLPAVLLLYVASWALVKNPGHPQSGGQFINFMKRNFQIQIRCKHENNSLIWVVYTERYSISLKYKNKFIL